MLKTPYSCSDPCWRNIPEVTKDVAGLREYVSFSNADANFFSYDTVAAGIFKQKTFFLLTFLLIFFKTSDRVFLKKRLSIVNIFSTNIDKLAVGGMELFHSLSYLHSRTFHHWT